MFSEFLIGTIVGGILGISGSLIATYLTHKWTEKRRLFEIRIEALTKTNSSMVNCFFKLNKFGNVYPKTLLEYQNEVEYPLKDFENTLNINSIWFDEELLKTLNEVRGIFRDVAFAIYLNLPRNQFPKGFDPDSYPKKSTGIKWQEFNNWFIKAEKEIKKRLS
jgi:hypothetical protein